MTSPHVVLALPPGAIARGSDGSGVWRAACDRAFRAPLVIKLLGANLLIALAAAAASAVWGNPMFVGFIVLALLASFAINAFLVRLALSPLNDLQRVAEHVARGERYVRARQSPIADRRIERLGTTLNRLLDEVHADHFHMHQSIRRSLAVREAERAAMAHQLREETAQQLSALSLQLAAADRGFVIENALTALRESREITSRIIDDVRRLADSVYPGLLQELGLPASLAALAARVRSQSRLRISVDAPDVAMRLAPILVTAMYHVAEEAVRNVEQHADAHAVRIRLYTTPGTVHLEVLDDGKGFDTAAAERTTAGIGLFEARELLASAHGELTIHSSTETGTRVIASARLDQGAT
jgi:two-component system, NarL family, sensor histidine kinase UhpB